MPPNRSKANASGLGKAIIKRRAKEAVAPKESQLYTLDESNPLQSITHERDLDEFLANAALADTDFQTERSKMRIIAGPGAGSAPGANPFLLSEAEEKEVQRKKYDYSSGLTVPRRPPWTRQTTRQELERQERESFLDWRRELAQLAERSNLLMTPFERNVQLWRQLWRVLERSHLIVQIVDARNPLGFRCADLENYVREIGDEGVGQDTTVPGKGKRKSLLLINKADLLTVEQRSMWADYFEKEKIAYAFFSAADAAAAQEQADKQRRREEGTYVEGESEEEDAEEGADEEEVAEVSGEEVEPEEESEEESPDEEEKLSKAVKDTTIGDDEEGWSTEGEHDDEDDIDEDEVEARLANGQSVPLKDVARHVAEKSIEQPESPRTRVLSVTELEDLFQSAAPDISDFATVRVPNPTKLVVGLVGYPNVGKSSTINALLGAKKVSVSSTPGKTKHFQTLNLSDEITLCDCPGLVFPQFANTQAELVIDGVLPIDQMREYSAPADLICRRVTRDILEGTYGIRIDVKEEEDGGTGQVTWEDLLSTYAIARGMTRASFGMPDTSRAARYILKDYVNAKLLFAHPPPSIDVDEFMSTSRERTMARINEEYDNGRKRAPISHVSKNADTYVAPAPGAPEPSGSTSTTGATTTEARQRQLTTQSVRANAASAPARSGKARAGALDEVFFTESGPAPRPVVKGRQNGDQQEGGLGFSRDTRFPHQRMLGPDGMPMVDLGIKTTGRDNSKRHFKTKEGKKRSGRGYD